MSSPDPNLELHRRWSRVLDSHGVENVRIFLAGNFYIPEVDREFGWRWLRQKDEEKRQADRRYAVLTLAASVVASVAAIAAVVVGVLGLK
jgi:hypothetical protein